MVPLSAVEQGHQKYGAPKFYFGHKKYGGLKCKQFHETTYKGLMW